MNRFETDRLRDIAIEYLPEAQKIRDNWKNARVTRGDYARKLWTTARWILMDVTLSAEKRAAAELLQALGAWGHYDPKDPEQQYWTEQEAHDCSMREIADAVKNLTSATDRVISFEYTPAATVEDVENDNEDDTTPKSKLEKQQQAILAVIEEMKYKPMEIPDGGKGIIKSICEINHLDDFNADTSFDRAWKEGIGKLWKMKYHDSYARRGIN